MKFIVTSRGEGKTTHMLQWLLDAPDGEARVLVCHSDREAMRLLRESRERADGLASWQFVGVEDVRGRPALAGVQKSGQRIVIGIDNLDLVLSQLLGSIFPIGVVAATGVLVDPVDSGEQIEERPSS